MKIVDLREEFRTTHTPGAGVRKQLRAATGGTRWPAGRRRWCWSTGEDTRGSRCAGAAARRSIVRTAASRLPITARPSGWCATTADSRAPCRNSAPNARFVNTSTTSARDRSSSKSDCARCFPEHASRVWTAIRRAPSALFEQVLGDFRRADAWTFWWARRWWPRATISSG